MDQMLIRHSGVRIQCWTGKDKGLLMSEVYYLDWWLGFSSRVLTKLILKILLKYDHAVFFKEDMTYNIMLVSGLQHNDLILVYF